MDNVIQIGNTQRGFTRMDNSIMEALAAVDLPAREFRVVMAIARQTIGYNVESKRLSADEIGKLTNMRRDVVSKAISHLLERRIMFRVGGSRGEVGISPVSEWSFFDEKQDRLSETKSSHSAQIVSLRHDASETKTATCFLYTKKESSLLSEELPPQENLPVVAEPVRKRAARLPDDWSIPAEWMAWALTDRPEFTQQDVLRTSEIFADYWRAKSGKDATKLDWFATWRNWFRRERSPKANRPSSAGPDFHSGDTSWANDLGDL